MAYHYFDQEMKKEIAPAIKELCRKYGVKGSLSVPKDYIVRLTVKNGGGIDFYELRANKEKPTILYEVRPGHNVNQFYTGSAASFLKEANSILKSLVTLRRDYVSYTKIVG